jgi:hypothetical protein
LSLLLIAGAITMIATPSAIMMQVKPAAAQGNDVSSYDTGTDSDAGSGGDTDSCPSGTVCAADIISTNTKSMTVDVDANGKVSGFKGKLHISATATAEADDNGKFTIEDTSGSAELTIGTRPPSTYTLSNLDIAISGAKVTMMADFEDQDGDTGTLTVKLFAKKKISIDDATTDVTSGSDRVTLDYETIDRHFSAPGSGIKGTISFA